MRSRVRLHALVLAVCIAAGFSAAGDGLKFLVSGGSYRTLGTPNWGDNNHVALIVLMVIPMLAYVREVSTERLVRLGALAGIALFVCGVVSTTSRGGFLGLLLLAGAGIVGSRHKIRYLLAVVALGAMLSQVVTENWTERMNSLEEVREDTSFMGRVIAWKISILIALDNPLVGGGLHAVQAGNIWNAYRVGFGQLSFIPTEDPDEYPRAAHSIYFEVLGDTGFLGLALFLAIIASSVWNGMRVKALARGHPELQWAAHLAGRLQLSLLIFAVVGAALSASYNDLNFIIFAILTAVRRVVADEIAGARARTGVPALAGARLADRAAVPSFGPPQGASGSRPPPA